MITLKIFIIEEVMVDTVESVEVKVIITKCRQCPNVKPALGMGYDMCHHPEFKVGFIANASVIDPQCPLRKTND